MIKFLLDNRASMFGKIKRGIKEPSKIYKRIKEIKNNFVRGRLILKEFNKNKESFFFVQIGANDGVKGDLLRKFVTQYHWKGILVEPVEWLYNKLKKNYKNEPALIFENCAISDRDCFSDFFYFEESSELGDIYDQVGSLKKETVLKHKGRIPSLNNNLKIKKVKCLCFESLLKKYNIKKVDFLHIDTEGNDWNILKTINFNKYGISAVLYEYIHLTREEFYKSKNYLKSFGFNYFRLIGNDLFAIRV
jgi:FkbM family methyltransferase